MSTGREATCARRGRGYAELGCEIRLAVLSGAAQRAARGFCGFVERTGPARTLALG